MRKILLVYLFTFFCLHFVYSQDLPKIVPPSPNASSIHIYGNNNINYYTGSTNITIPIYEIKEGDINLPIYLKYTGSNGIRVEEIASWVGLGWSLNAGGAISRTIRGIADDQDYNGWLSSNTLLYPQVESNILVNVEDFLNIADNKKDGEPDLFFYNYPGGNGSFFFDIENNVRLKPWKNILISYNSDHFNDSSISNSNISIANTILEEFVINDEQGNIYHFNEKERSNTIVLGQPLFDNSGYPSTWYLTQIENRNKTKQINFLYEAFSYDILRQRGRMMIQNGDYERDEYIKTYYLAKRLKKNYIF